MESIADDGACERVARSVLEYLLCHPRARDTAEGIYTWWLGPLSHSVPQSIFVQALDRLKTMQWLLVFKTGEGVETIGLNEAYLSDIEVYLDRRHGPEGKFAS